MQQQRGDNNNNNNNYTAIHCYILLYIARNSIVFIYFDLFFIILPVLSEARVGRAEGVVCSAYESKSKNYRQKYFFVVSYMYR